MHVINIIYKVNFRLPPQSRWDLRSSGILRNKDFSTLKDGTDRLCRNVGKELPLHDA